MTETEVKIRWQGTPAEAQAHIESCGYQVVAARTLEVDQLFDRQSETDEPLGKSPGQLQSSGQVLRLRRRVRQGTESCTVTYKGPAQEGPYKSREEIEFDVSAGDAFELVLCRLGYLPGFRYEKYRTTFGLTGRAGIVTLDETPLGVFLELEGAESWIEEAARRLGFTAEAYLKSSYAGLYRDYRAKHPEVPENMTFVP